LGWGNRARKLTGCWAAFLVLALSAGVLAPMGSAAAAEPLPAPTGFRLPASNGYTLAVLSGLDSKTGRGYVLLMALSPDAQVIYNAPASVTATSIEADLGPAGRIDVDYAPSSGTHTEQVPCGKDSVTFDSGSYVGVIDFHGEEGYSEAHAASVPGEIKTTLSLLCLGPIVTEGFGAHEPGARLTAQRARAPQLQFGAAKNSPTRLARFGAAIKERRGQMRISRFVEASSGPGAFDFDVPGGFAQVSPPAPFSGEATYRKRGKQTSWRGNLTVDFPGRSNVRLTGAGVRAGMRRAVLNPSHPFRIG
jgi:hypothetical protein